MPTTGDPAGGPPRTTGQPSPPRPAWWDLWGRAQPPIDRLRARVGWFDHASRAAGRFTEVNGGRLAAAMTYYAFLAVFPLVALAFAILGFALAGDPVLTAEVAQALAENLPGFPVTDIAGSRNTAGLIGVVGFFVAGLGWVDAVRTSVRTVWRRPGGPGNPVLVKVVDAVALVGLGLALGVSLGLSVLVSAGAEWVLSSVGLSGGGVARVSLEALAVALGVVVNVVLFVGLLAGLPRLRMALGRVLVPAVLAAVGLEVLKTAGRLYIERVQVNPVYQTVVVAVGLLVFLNLLDNLLVYSAALTATSDEGEVTDLADAAPGDAAAGAGASTVRP